MFLDELSQLCILSEDGERREPRVRTTPARFADVLGDRPRARILLEASTESEWVARCLERQGEGQDSDVLEPIASFHQIGTSQTVVGAHAQAAPGASRREASRASRA